MKPFLLRSIAVYGALLLYGCATMSARTPDLRREIEAVNRQFERFIAQGDADGIATLYTEDTQMLPPDAEPLVGRETVRAMMRAGLNGLRRAEFRTLEVEGMGDTAFELGAYTFFGPDEQPFGRGRYIILWKRDGGEWRIHRDMWTAIPLDS